MRTHCNHGKSWDEACPECEQVWANSVTYPQLARTCERCAQELEDKPFLASDPRVIADLYRAIGRLTKMIEAQQPSVESASHE